MTRGKQCGATLVEAAYTTMVFFTFLFAIMEFGRVYNMYQTLTNAAREGARFAVAPCSVSPSACPFGIATPQGIGGITTNPSVKYTVASYLQADHIPVNDANIKVCRHDRLTNADTADCAAMGVTACDPSLTVNSLQLCDTIVQVSAPYNFFFLQTNGQRWSLNIATQARMRDEIQN